MEALDLHIGDRSLASLEKKLGFRHAYHLGTLSVQSQKDLVRASGEPCALESSDIELLVAGIRKDAVALVNPFCAKGFEREPKLFRKIAEEGKALEVPMNQFFECAGFKRAGRFHLARKAVALARKFKVPLVITSRAKNEFECRSPHELAAIAKAFLGMTDVEANAALSKNPKRIAEECGLSAVA